MSGETNTPETNEAEQRTGPTPRIYVASLSDYNAGRLHGRWIDAAQEADEIWAEVNEMLARSREPFAEEVAIHDYEGFGPLHLSEYDSLSMVSLIGRGFAEHGRAFLHWAAYVGTNDADELDRFEDAYLGWFESMSELGEEMADAHGIERILDEHLPEFVRPYVSVDYEQIGRDIASPCFVANDDEDGGVYLFAT